jgi:ubiquinol-cytochrome c reductase cytochrome c subunit
LTGRRVILAALAGALLAAVPAAAAPAPKLVRQGKALYGTYCIACHGANGKGVEAGRPTGGSYQREERVVEGAGPSLRGVGALAADFYLRTGYMPLHELKQPRRGRVLFSERELQALIAYVASLGAGPPVPSPRPEEGNLAQGLNLFTEHCAGCHQVVAEGGYVTGALPPPLEDATSTQIAEAVRIGPWVMPTFSKSSISDRQLNSIIRYIRIPTTAAAGRSATWVRCRRAS